MYLTYGITPYLLSGPGSASSIVTDYPTSNKQLVPKSNNGGSTPTPGDILAMSYGHTAIVSMVSIDQNGSGKITVLEQNGSEDSTGTRDITVANRIVGDSVSAWLHDPLGGRYPANLFQIENAGSGWVPYNLTPMLGDQQIVNKPGVVWEPSSSPYVYAADKLGALRKFTPCSGGWCNTKLTGDGGFSGGMVATPTPNNHTLFAPSADGALLQIETAGSGIAIYNISSMLGNIKIMGAPGVIWNNGFNVFAVDTNGALKQFAPCPTGGWCQYTLSPDGWYKGGVSAFMNGSAIEIVARSTGNHLYQIEKASPSWTTFDITNAANVVTITGTPGAYWANGMLNAYAADWDGTMRQFTLCPSLTSWCSYSLTGDHAMGDGATALLRNGVPELFSASY